MSTERVSLDTLESEPHATLFAAEPKTIRLSLDAGEGTAPHQHPDRQIVRSLLAGELDVQIGEQQHRLTAGDVVRFEGDQDISPNAVEDSEALLVMAQRPG